MADEPVDLSLSDVMMPKMGGIEFVQEVRKIPKYQATTIIMLTTVSEIKEMQKGKDAGANNWLKNQLMLIGFTNYWINTLSHHPDPDHSSDPEVAPVFLNSCKPNCF